MDKLKLKRIFDYVSVFFSEEIKNIEDLDIVKIYIFKVQSLFTRLLETILNQLKWFSVYIFIAIRRALVINKYVIVPDVLLFNTHINFT